MLYSLSKQPWSEDQFQNPDNAYRSTVFWAWNCKLDPDQLGRQIDTFQQMGLGGFYMHSRTGMATSYLSDEFFSLIRHCIGRAEEHHMKAWLYDEDRWPSGSAGGFVTQDPDLRARHLYFTTELLPCGERRMQLAVYAISLNSKGELSDYSFAGSPSVPENPDFHGAIDSDDTTAAGLGHNTKIWRAYLEIEETSPWYNNQAYVNTLDKRAIDRFKELTHERYAARVGETFSKTVPGIFTDEPQFTKKTVLPFAHDEGSIILPWTDDLPQTFRDTFGEDLIADLPQLIWDLPDSRTSRIRYAYHLHISERFAQAFSDNLGDWCSAHNLLLTGHMMEEPTLKSQTAALGEVMRSLSSFQLPGVDILCDRREYTTVKQAQSVARQYGREGVLSESCGVTGWDFDFRGHKLQGDWQLAMGVTLRTLHLSWVSMKGEAKRDYPASISSQVPWHLRYRLLEDHFSRSCYAMTRGRPVVRIGVIHPIESYWLHWGPSDQTSFLRDQMDMQFRQLTEWLLFGSYDFDFIAESLLSGQTGKDEDVPHVGCMRYDMVLVPGCETLRGTTVRFLQSCIRSGCTVLFIGALPDKRDAIPDASLREVFCDTPHIPMDRFQLLQELEPFRDIRIFRHNGEMTDNLLYQLREEEDCRWLFIAHGRQPVSNDEGTGHPGRDVLPQENIRIQLSGEWIPEQYDTMSGGHHPIACNYAQSESGYYPAGEQTTEIRLTFYAHDSLLFCLRPGKGTQDAPSGEKPMRPYRLGRLSLEPKDAPSEFYPRAPVSLSEPNVLVLDIPEYALDGEPYHTADEILRLDNHLRERLGFPPRQNAVAQPWVLPPAAPSHRVRLRYAIDCRIPLAGCHLALESAEDTKIRLNGMDIPPDPDGYYVDESIRTIPLPPIQACMNLLELDIPFGRTHGIESCCLLGDFSVLTAGSQNTLSEGIRSLAFGDATRQGLSFYGGNITYHLDIQSHGNPWHIRVPMYRGALVDILIDGRPAGALFLSPYHLCTSALPAGVHRISLCVYGSRINTFGALHNCNENWWWHGPDAYRVYRDEWSYEYNLHPTGILKSPELWEDPDTL